MGTVKRDSLDEIDGSNGKHIIIMFYLMTSMLKPSAYFHTLCIARSDGSHLYTYEKKMGSSVYLNLSMTSNETEHAL